MPIYDYHCDHCGHVFSAVQSYTDATLEKCPSCGKKPRKLMTTPAIVFKGGGWYKTDSRAKPKEDGASAAKAEPGKAETAKTDGAAPPKTDAPKTETKLPAKKSEAASS